MAAPTTNDLGAFLGREIDAGQATAVLGIITAMASAYTRGQGFTAGVPNSDISAVVLAAAARLLSEPTQIVASEEMGPFATSFRSGFDGWTVAELFVLDRYRVRAL